MDRRPGRGALILLVGALFLLVATVAATADPHVARVPVPRVEPLRLPSEGPRDASPDAEVESEAQPREADIPLPAWLGGLALLLLAGLVLVVLWHTLGDRVTVRRAREETATSAAERKAEVRAAVAAGIDELDVDGTDPRSAVIACWLRLERAAAAAGTRREPSDTAGDLIARMLAEHDVSAPVLDRFGAVYRRARYAPHEIGEAMRDEARAALRRVHAELSHDLPRPAPDGGPASPERQPTGEVPE